MIEELDVVALIRSLPEHSLREGEMGTVVMIYGDHAAYEVEFMDGDSPYTKALITLMTGRGVPDVKSIAGSARRTCGLR